MKFSPFSLLATFAASALAQDLLFVDTFQYQEYTEATATLGLTAKVVTVAEWKDMKTADFAKFKAIVIADPYCGGDASVVEFLAETKDVWGPAVKGNIVLIGTDPTFHFTAQPGAKTLIDNAISFSAAAKTLSGASQTGLYFALSCYYHSVNSAPVPALSYFGDFVVRGNLDCYNNAHVVASSPALGTLDDAALSNWACSVHEAFSVYPTEGVNGFQALAIAKDIVGEGSKPFAGGVVGLPYIISRGATPDGCGDGKWNKDLGEECDDGNTVDGDGCDKSCKCESGRPSGDGKCLPKIPDTPPVKNYTVPYGYGNTSVTVTKSGYATITEYPPSVTPYSPHGPKIIGVEIIVYVTIIEDCKTLRGSTVTSYSTSTCSTNHRPIWDVKTPGYPCYICEDIPTSKFITASVTSCLSPPPTYTPAPPIIHACSTCLPITLSTCPVYSSLPATEVYEIAAPTVEKHEHEAVTVTPASYYVSVVPSSTEAYTMKEVVATESAKVSHVPFTGGASAGKGGVNVVFRLGLGLLVGIGMVLL